VKSEHAYAIAAKPRKQPDIFEDGFETGSENGLCYQNWTRAKNTLNLGVRVFKIAVLLVTASKTRLSIPALRKHT
jgi:hypothetical protein